MSWPEDLGPFGVPTTRKELETFMWTTGILYGFFSVKYALDVWHAIPRMAHHHYRNPSRRAIVAAARAQTARMSLLRFATLTGLGPLLAIVFFATAVKDIVGEKITHDFEYDRIDRATAMAMGYRAQDDPWGTSDDFPWHTQSHPYYENEEGEHMWYSFHPENI